MARPREFEIGAAVDRAMDVFWSKGYEAASLHDLLAAMGIARGSLYKAFPDKRAVYLAALDRYDGTVVAGAVALLADESLGDGPARLRRLLDGAIAEARDTRPRRGCFLCNAAIDQAPHDPVVRDRVMAMMRRLEAAIGAVLPPLTGETAPEHGVRTRALLTAYMGIRVMAKAGYPLAALEEIVAATLAPLEHRPGP